MAAHSPVLDIYSEENEILLNPRWPRRDYELLYQLAVQAQEEKKLQAHVWVATSGSTAEDLVGTKLVALSKQALRHSAEAVNLHLQAGPRDVWGQVLPSFHVGGLGVEVRAQRSEARVVPLLQENRWDVDFFYKQLREQHVTLTSLVPTQIYDLVMRHYRAPSALRAVVVGGGAFERELYEKARALDWPVLPSYGMTETASQIATASLQSLAEAEYPEMSLLSHAEARADERGFLQVRAQSLFSCYAQYRNNTVTVWDPKLAGWFTTEDQGEVAQGSIKVQGRGGDYIKIGGEAVSLPRLRSLLAKCVLEEKGRVDSVVLLDMPSDRLGKQIHAVSVVEPLLTEKMIQSYSQQVLPFEKIRKIHYIREIPRSELGKILWGRLRSML
ncbi:MAG: AMP-binding protein [Bdellovibrio sp.]